MGGADGWSIAVDAALGQLKEIGGEGSLAELMGEAIAKRFEPYRGDRFTILASSLDHRVAHTSLSREATFAALRETVVAIHKWKKSALVAEAPEAQADAEGQPDAKRCKTEHGSLLRRGLLAASRSTKVLSDEDMVAAELATYKVEVSRSEGDMATSPTTWWEARRDALPTISLLGPLFASAPASTCSVERLFSIASRIFSPKRTSLHPSRLGMLCTMKHNFGIRKEIHAMVGVKAEEADAVNPAAA